MRKYLALTQTGLKNTLIYTADFFLWSFSEFLDTLIFLFVWIVIYGDKDAIAGFSLSETVTYLIGVGLINNLISSRMINWLERDIQTGRLSGFLVQPLSYPYARFFLSFSAKPLNLGIRTAVYLLVALFFRDKIVFNTDWIRWLLLFLSVFLALVINNLLDFCAGCVAFWTTTTSGFSGIVRTAKSIFSGGYAPLVFFPVWFQRLSTFLPFAYTRYFPMMIYLDKMSLRQGLEGMVIQLLWIVILFFLAKLIWIKGLKKYEGVGI